jgi:hypothetical protein
MCDRLFRKGLVVVIILMFFGIGVIQSISSNITAKESSKIFTIAPLDVPLPPLMWTEDFTTFYICTPQNPDGDVVYYWIDWGDGTYEDWFGPFESGETVYISHLWNDEGAYQIKVIAKDQDGKSKCAVYSLTLLSDFDLKLFRVKIGYVGITYIFTIHWASYEYLRILWGDDTEEWFGPDSLPILFSHSWSSPGQYGLMLKMKDIYGNESDWFSFFLTILNLDNNSPNPPIIWGQTIGRIGEKCVYSFFSTDTDCDDVMYLIDWGDGNLDETDYYPSGEVVKVSHTWIEKGEYTIKAKAIDNFGSESDWSDPLTVTIKKGKNRVITSPFQWFLQQYQNMFPILRHLLRL